MCLNQKPKHLLQVQEFNSSTNRNCIFKFFFIYIKKASVHNYPNDNALFSFAKSVTLLVKIRTT